jgi:hypothetical protein
MRIKLKYGFLIALTLASMAWADTLELKNGSLIRASSWVAPRLKSATRWLDGTKK